MPFYRIGRRFEALRIRSTQPEKEIWFYLSEDESLYRTKEKLHDFYSHEDISFSEDQIEETALNFVSSLKQGKEYFNAAKSVSLLTRPLMIFYGVLCLSKLLIILDNPNYTSDIGRDRTLRLHGLGYKDNATDAVLIEDDEIDIKSRGTFPMLYKCFSSNIPANTRFKLSELYGWIPEVCSHFPHVSPRFLFAQTGIMHADQGYRLEIKVKENHEFYPNEADVRSTFDFLDNDFDFISRSENNLTYHGKNENTTTTDRNLESERRLENYISKFISYDRDGRGLIIPSDGSFILNNMLALYMVMYCYGRICRYMPNKWQQVVAGVKSNERYVIEYIIDLCFESYPQLLLSKFYDRPVIISQMLS